MQIDGLSVRHDMPRDEFYRRSGKMEMGCLDDDNAFVEVHLK